MFYSSIQMQTSHIQLGRKTKNFCFTLQFKCRHRISSQIKKNKELIFLLFNSNADVAYLARSKNKELMFYSSIQMQTSHIWLGRKTKNLCFTIQFKCRLRISSQVEKQRTYVLLFNLNADVAYLAKSKKQRTYVLLFDSNADDAYLAKSKNKEVMFYSSIQMKTSHIQLD